MDAKNIFIACNHMKNKISWEKESGNEWSFVGEGNDFKENEVQDFVDSYFNEKELYLVVDRHNALSIFASEAASKIKGYLDKKDVVLCNKRFDKMIEFNYIGVAKHGKIAL